MKTEASFLPGKRFLSMKLSNAISKAAIFVLPMSVGSLQSQSYYRGATARRLFNSGQLQFSEVNGKKPGQLE